MGFLIVDQGLQDLGLALFVNGIQEDWIVEFYVNNHTPVNTDVTGDYTPPTDAAYSPQSMTRASMTQSFVPSVFTATGPALTFNFSTSVETIYGYFVRGATSGDLQWAQDFAVPFTLPGAPIVLTLTLDIQYQNCP